MISWNNRHQAIIITNLVWLNTRSLVLFLLLFRPWNFILLKYGLTLIKHHLVPCNFNPFWAFSIINLLSIDLFQFHSFCKVIACHVQIEDFWFLSSYSFFFFNNLFDIDSLFSPLQHHIVSLLPSLSCCVPLLLCVVLALLLECFPVCWICVVQWIPV